MMKYTMTQWLIFFYIYCFFGWVWECIFVSVRKRKLVNRGFLKGPLLPIYGSGAICILVVTLPVRGNIPAMFLIGMVAATALEYVTGWAMEKLFHVRYWDYTGQFLNINGHVCLGSTLCWGVLTVLVVEIFHVKLETLVFSFEPWLVDAAAFVITPLFAVDVVTSFHTALHLRDVLIQKERIAAELKRLAERREELERALQEAGEKAREQAREQIRQELRDLYISIGARRERLHAAHTKSVRSLIRRNPSAVSKLHRESFAELKKTLSERIDEIRNEK